jgi:O-antigen/teichoic acid export membrane protein
LDAPLTKGSGGDRQHAMSAGGEHLESVSPATGWRAKIRERFADGGIARVLARGAIWSIGINVAGYSLSLVVQVLLTRSLGTKEYGYYAYALAWMNAALLIGKLELDTAALRFVGLYDGAKSWSLLRGFLTRSYQLVWAASVGVSMLGAIIVWFAVARRGNGAAASLWAACALLPATALLQFRASCLQGFKKVPESQGPLLVLRPVLFGAGVLFSTYVIGTRVSAAGALLINLLAAIIAIVLVGRFLRATLPAPVREASPSYETRDWLHTSMGLLVVAGAQLVLGTQSDVLVVGTWLGPTEAGRYLVASQLASIITFGVTAIMYMALAMIADLHGRGLTAELQKLVTLLTRASIVVSLPIVIVIALLGTTLLGLFGPTFRTVYPVLVVLSTGYFVAAVVGILAGFLLTLTGHQRQAAVLVVGSAVGNLALSVTLTPIFGTIGTAVATTITSFVRAGLLALYCWKLLGVRLSPFSSANSPPAGA